VSKLSRETKDVTRFDDSHFMGRFQPRYYLNEMPLFTACLG